MPFDDGSSIQLWDDDARCEEEIVKLAPGDLKGWQAFSDVKRRLRDALRPAGERDLWIGRAPARDEIERRLGNDDEARKASVRVVDGRIRRAFPDDDTRLQSAYLGQGVIGTFASPHDRGTASIHFHHQSGRQGGTPGHVGLRPGRNGHGVVHPLRHRPRRRSRRPLTGAPVARIIPGIGVELAGGERVTASCVVSNADPRTTLALLGDAADPAWRARVLEVPQTGCTVKLNVALRELPSFKARPGTRMPHHLGQINTPLSKDRVAVGIRGCPGRPAARAALVRALFSNRARLERGTRRRAHDERLCPVRPAHIRQRRLGYAAEAMCATSPFARSADFCENIPEAIIDVQVLGPPDIEREVGLTGGHIFQGECLPENMWDRRFSPRTPMPGVFLCGACTYPGGSVIAINGRNAAMEVLGKL